MPQNWLLDYYSDDLIAEFTLSSQASLDLDNTHITSVYKRYRIELYDVVPANDGVDFQMRVSTDGGATYITTTSYDYGVMEVTTSGAVSGTGNAAGSAMVMTSNPVGSGTGEGVDGVIDVFDPLAVARTRIQSHLTFDSTANTLLTTYSGGRHDSEVAVDGLQLLFTAGNIESGLVRLFGIR